MLKEIQSGFTKFFTRDKVIILIALIILGYGLFSYTDFKTSVVDNMGDGYEQSSVPSNVPKAPVAPVAPSAGNVIGTTSNEQPSDYNKQQVANPSDLLPIDQNSQWAALNPSAMSKGNIVMPDLLQAGYHIGLDTIGQTLRNANLQLRSDPMIIKKDVGPWLQSTIEPDFGRVPLEIGQCPQ
jgi:hypothetical protein